MNTQAHAVVNLALLGEPDTPEHNTAVLLGSVAPDLQIVAFYFYEKLVNGTSEADMWREGGRYFAVHEWFDWLNSIPLSAAVAWAAQRAGWLNVRGFALGVLLHSAADLLCHREDAHRHFLPLSSWRFVSPVSYWDPAHYGGYFMVFETSLVLGCLWVLAGRHDSRVARVGIGLVLLSYAALAMVIGLFWMGAV